MLLKRLIFNRVLVRSIKTSPLKLQQPSLVKAKKLQADFQCDDGKPVWLKGGFCDRILYGTTIILCLVGLIMDVAFIYDAAKPPSWRNPKC